MIRALFLSLDRSLVLKKSGVMGDAKERFLQYSTRADIKMLVRVPGDASDEPGRPGNFLEIFPVPSGGYLSYVSRGYRAAAALFKTWRPDVICAQDPFATGWLGARLKRGFGIPLMIQLHTDFIHNPAWYRENLKNRAAHVLALRVIRRADGVQGVSRLICGKMRAMGFPESGILYLPTGGGIDLDRFQNADGASERKTILGDRYDKLIVFVGRIAKQKNLPLLVESVPAVLAEFPRALFLICGDGKERGRIESLIRAKNLQGNVRIEGEVSYHRVPSILAGADLFALPSAYEGTARVLEEASAVETPCVTTDVSGARDVIDDGRSGWVVPPGDAGAFASAVIAVLRNPKEAKAMARKARETVLEHFDQKKHSLRLIEFLEKLVTEKGSV